MITVNELQNNLTALQESYNTYQMDMPTFDQFAPNVRIEKMDNYRQNGFHVYKENFIKLTNKFIVLTKYNLNQINQLKYPLLASENTSDKSLHEQKSMNAKMLIGQFGDNHAVILNEVQKAKQFDDLDYTNSLLDIYFNVNSSSERLSSKDKEVYEEILNFRNQLNEEIGVTPLNKEVKTLNHLLDVTNNFIEALDKGALRLFSPEQYDAMGDEEYFLLRQKITDSVGTDEFNKIHHYATRKRSIKGN